MTTLAAAEQYLQEHLETCRGKGYAVYNPHDKPESELPAIYGFNNGGSPGMLSAVLITEDGHGIGGHLCSHEGYMLNDLGILEGTRKDRHETFRKHYPDGYRMEWVESDEIKAKSHAGLMSAYARNQEIAKLPKVESKSEAIVVLTATNGGPVLVKNSAGTHKVCDSYEDVDAFFAASE